MAINSEINWCLKIVIDQSMTLFLMIHLKTVIDQSMTFSEGAPYSRISVESVIDRSIIITRGPHSKNFDTVQNCH